ncbi:MAG TPA: PAS domain S-box protein [Opitutaceae bacterium]|nr:PAS domain S-box protein [Opitutaceae bacterium]
MIARSGALGASVLALGGCSGSLSAGLSPAAQASIGGVAIAAVITAVLLEWSRRRLTAELRRADRAVDMSEERYRLLLEQSTDAIVVADAETGLILQVNRSAGQLLGYAEQELVGRRHTILHPESQREVMREKFIQHARRGEILERESTVQHRNGTIIPVQVRASLVTSGGKKYFQAILRDSRPRLESEAAMRRSEARLREVEDRWQLAVRALNVGIFEKNYLTGETYLSDRWKEMLGYAAQDFQKDGEEWQSRIHPDDRERVLAELQAHLRGENDLYRVEYRMLCRDASYKWISACGRAVFDATGNPQRLIGTHTDISERMAAEEALRSSESRYRNLFENAAEGVYDTNASGKFLAANPALARMLGYSSPKHLIEAIHSAARDFYFNPKRREEFFQVLGSNNSVTGFESEVRCFDGSVKWITENVRAVRDNAGEISHFEGFVSDITDRKRAEAAIRASEERYRVLFEHSPVAILEHDYRPLAIWMKRLRDQGVEDLQEYMKAHPDEVGIGFERFPIVGVNEEAVRLTRCGSKRELMERFDRIFLPDGIAARQQAFLAVWEGRQEIEGELTVRAVDGSIRRTYFRWWLPKLDGPETSDWTQIVLLDMTDMRSAEAELAAERERLRVTLRAMAEGLMTTDIFGVVQFMNDAAERLTGWTAGAAIGRSVDEICVLRHEKTKADVSIPVGKAIAEHRVIDFPLQTSLLNRHGLPCLIDGRCAPMHDGSGQAIGAVVVFRDVTERARLEAELLRSSKLEAVGILAGGIAHDFNNILTVVMGNVTLAMLDSVVMEAAGKWLDEAERGVMRARDLTQQLLTFAKGGQPVRKAVQLPDVVREAAQFALHGSKVRCEFSQEPNVWPADVDQGQIGQVVQNLVINAVQAMPDGGVVHISLSNDVIGADSRRPLAMGSYIKVVIGDTGMGIRAEHLARIFDPYFTTKQSGSGLGLATVYSIVRKHQGHIEVESELGKGTRFIFWLPAAPDSAPQRTETPEVVAKVSGRVLFMDDEETIRTMASTLLMRLGLEVTAVPDGEAALKHYREARDGGKAFELVIMDLTVPGGMGGREAMQELLKIDPHVRAIVSSGYSSDPVLSNYRAHGFRGMVPKPYRFADLARTISIVMADR